jgi:CDGSH-type Zn-finger protein
MAVMVKGLKSGPLEISGAVNVLDCKGKEYADAADPVYLCHCGQSKSKPYCDGSHAVVGFKSEETAGQDTL